MLTLLLMVAMKVPAQSHTATVERSADARLLPVGSLPVVAAHRGGFFGDPNTLEQFLESTRGNSADVLEMDLRLTADGQVVVFHDPKLAPKTWCTGQLSEQTMEQLKRCKLRRNDFSIPSFAGVLDALAGHILVDAEFKTDEVVAPALAQVAARHAESWVYFQVGNNRSRYALARRLNAKAQLQYKATSDADMAWAIGLDDPYLVIIEMDRDFITPQRVAAAHAHGKLVSENSWRYQFFEERFSASCDRTFELGVDIAVTNSPVSCAAQRYGRQQPPRRTWLQEVFSRQRVRQFFRGQFG